MLEAVDERPELLKRVRLVRVSHDHVLAAGGFETGRVGASVSAPRFDDGRAPRG